MKKTGQMLKEAREAKSISLQEVSIHLKINTKTLKSLETGDITQLPAKTFLRGFVQSYAQFLKLDLNHIMEVFQDEMGSTHPGMITTQIVIPPPNVTPSQMNQPPANSMSAHFQSMPKPILPQTINQTPATALPKTPAKKSQMNEPMPPSISFDPQTWSHSLKIGTAIIVLLIISLIIGIKKTIDKYEREATLPKQERQEIEKIARPDTSKPSFNNITGIQDTDSTAGSIGTIPPNLSIATEALSLTSKPVATPAPTNSNIAIVGSPQPSPELIVVSDINPQEVIIEALDKVMVEYSIDGGPKNSISLMAEKIHTFKAQKNITLSFSDGGSVNLIHNGKDKGVPGNLGQPFVVSFPK